MRLNTFSHFAAAVKAAKCAFKKFTKLNISMKLCSVFPLNALICDQTSVYLNNLFDVVHQAYLHTVRKHSVKPELIELIPL